MLMMTLFQTWSWGAVLALYVLVALTFSFGVIAGAVWASRDCTCSEDFAEYYPEVE